MSLRCRHILESVHPKAWLIAPASAADACRLFHPRVYDDVRLDQGTPVVLWLDDLETFARSAGAGLTAAHLDELRLEDRSVIVLCTIGGKGLDANRDMVDDRALAEIVALGGAPISVGRRLDANELSAFRETFRINAPASVRETGLGPYLVGASGVTELWRNGRHAGVKDVPVTTVAEGLCLLDGLLAFDTERGFGEWSFDDSDLESAWSIFRGPDRGIHGPPDPEILSQAIQWCTTEVSAGHPVLRRDRQNRSWLLSEVLVEYVREECLDNRDIVVAYERAAELSADEAARRYVRDKGDEVGRQPYEEEALGTWLDLERWALIARRLHRLDVELRIYENIVDVDPCLTRVKLALVLLSIGDEGGIKELETAARHGDEIAKALLPSDNPSKSESLKKCVRSPSLAVAGRLADLLELADDRKLADLVEGVIDEIVVSGGGPVLAAVGQSMVRRRLTADRFDEIYSSVLDRADGSRSGDLGAVMLEALQTEGAEPLLRRAAATTPKRLFDLGELLSLSQDDTREAIDVLRRSAEVMGDPRALQTLAALFVARLDSPQEAEAIYRSAVAVEHVWAFDRLADHLSSYGSDSASEVKELRDRGALLRRSGRQSYSYVPLFVRLGI